MGQEASLPDDPDFEEKAKAPPSASNPPQHQQLLSSASIPPHATSGRYTQPQQPSHQMLPRGPKAIMGVFRHQQQQQVDHTSSQWDTKVGPTAAAGGGNDNLYYEEYYGTNGDSIGPAPPAQQQQHSIAVQNPFDDPRLLLQQQQQQQQQHNQAYPPTPVHNNNHAYYQQQQQQHSPPPPPPPPLPPPAYGTDGDATSDGMFFAAHDGQHDVVPKQQQEPPAAAAAASYAQETGHDAAGGGGGGVAVGIMFEKTPSGSNKRGMNIGGGGAGGLFPGRAQARGAALINSMRNLSLGGALSRTGSGKQQAKGPPSQQQQGVNNWEKQWDEDEDSDDEDDEGEEQTSALHQAQPGMDSVTAAAAAAPVYLAQQQQQGQPHDAWQQQQVISEPSFDMAAAAPPQQQTPQAPDLLSDDYATAVGGAEWDSSESSHQQQQFLQQQEQEAVAKPNVQMFMPMLRVLGKGSFGKVVLVQKRVGKERGQLFAMKILRKTHLVKRRQIERTRTERKVLSVVNHPFIMKLHYAFQTDDKLYLVLDYCPGGELFFHLSRFRRFPERVARFYAAELLLAIGHLHKRGIIYRDLKPENVLLDAEGHVKLGDFGLAKAGIKHPYEGAASMCGTPEYMAPEVLAQQGHGFCVDYWGLGMLTYEMMTGLPPWYTTDRAKLFRRLKSAPLDIPTYFSAASADCVSALLERNPRRRLGATGVRAPMEHEFFRNISWRSLYARRVEAPIRPCEGWKAPEAINDELVQPMSPTRSSMSTASSPVDVDKLEAHELEAATQNFDSTFTRMAVESEDVAETPEDDAAAAEELNAETFRGFSFDGRDHKELSGLAEASRQRSPNHQFIHQIE